MINLTDKYKTRSGLPVRVLSLDGPSHQPVVAVVSTADKEQVVTYNLNGHAHPTIVLSYDLVPARKTYEHWENVYLDGTIGARHPSREAADRAAIGKVRFACLHITCTEGEGL